MLKKMMDEIKDWKNYKFDRQAYAARVDALPEKYRIMYMEISKYMWSVAVDGTPVMDALMDILGMLEDGARDNKDVLDIIGNDITGFCDGILKELPNKTWMDRMKSDMNRRILKKLNK